MADKGKVKNPTIEANKLITQKKRIIGKPFIKGNTASVGHGRPKNHPLYQAYFEEKTPEVLELTFDAIKHKNVTLMKAWFDKAIANKQSIELKDLRNNELDEVDASLNDDQLRQIKQKEDEIEAIRKGGQTEKPGA